MKLHATEVGGVFLFSKFGCRSKLKLHAAEAGGVFVLTLGAEQFVKGTGFRLFKHPLSPIYSYLTFDGKQLDPRTI